MSLRGPVLFDAPQGRTTRQRRTSTVTLRWAAPVRIAGAIRMSPTVQTRERCSKSGTSKSGLPDLELVMLSRLHHHLNEIAAARGQSRIRLNWANASAAKRNERLVHCNCRFGQALLIKFGKHVS